MCAILPLVPPPGLHSRPARQPWVLRLPLSLLPLSRIPSTVRLCVPRLNSEMRSASSGYPLRLISEPHSCPLRRGVLYSRLLMGFTCRLIPRVDLLAVGVLLLPDAHTFRVPLAFPSASPCPLGRSCPQSYCRTARPVITRCPHSPSYLTPFCLHWHRLPGETFRFPRLSASPEVPFHLHYSVDEEHSPDCHDYSVYHLTSFQRPPKRSRTFLMYPHAPHAC